MVAGRRPSLAALREGIGFALVSPADIELAPDSIMQPDVLVIRAEVAHEDEPLHWPDVEYWIVDQDARVVERWTLARDRGTTEPGVESRGQ